MAKFNYLLKKLWYKVELFISKGGISVFYALAILLFVNIIILLLIRYFMLWFIPDTTVLSSDGDLGSNLYHLLLEVTDPGNMASFIERPFWIKITAILAGLSGIVIFSLLVALITTGTERLLRTIAEGTSQVYESGHYIIIGNNSRLHDILQELVMASEFEKNRVVVFSEEIDRDINIFIKKRNKLTIVLRKGKTTSPQILKRLALEKSKGVIVLSTCESYSSVFEKEISDTKVIKICFALSISITNGKNLIIIPEIFMDSNRKVVRNILSNNALLFDPDTILSKLLVQTSLFNGLVSVYEELFSFAGSELYFIKNTKENLKFGEISYYLNDGIAIGYKCPTKGLLLNPPSTDILGTQHTLLLVMSDKTNFHFSKNKLGILKNIHLLSSKPKPMLKSKIILGWNSRTYDIITEYDKYLTDDSKIKLVLTADCNPNMAEVEKLLKQIKSVFIVESVIELDELYLDSLELYNYDMLVLLKTCADTENNEIVDSRNIKHLLIIQKIFGSFSELQKKPVVISEVLNTSNLELFSRMGLSDFLLSNRIVSIFLTQLTIQPDLLDVFDVLLTKEGAEIYFRPTTNYFSNFDLSYSMIDLIQSAQYKNEVAIGYKRFLTTTKPNGSNFEIILNPPKLNTFQLTANDFLIVLADEY